MEGQVMRSILHTHPNVNLPNGFHGKSDEASDRIRDSQVEYNVVNVGARSDEWKLWREEQNYGSEQYEGVKIGDGMLNWFII